MSLLINSSCCLLPHVRTLKQIRNHGHEVEKRHRQGQDIYQPLVAYENRVAKLVAEMEDCSDLDDTEVVRTPSSTPASLPRSSVRRPARKRKTDSVAGTEGIRIDSQVVVPAVVTVTPEFSPAAPTHPLASNAERSSPDKVVAATRPRRGGVQSPARATRRSLSESLAAIPAGQRERRRRNNGIICGMCDKKIEDVNLWSLLKDEEIQIHIKEHVICMKCHPPRKDKEGVGYVEPPKPKQAHKACYYKMGSQHEYKRYSPGYVRPELYMNSSHVVGRGG